MDYQALIEMAVLAGEIMLVSGAEVYRIEDTVSRILKQSGLENRSFRTCNGNICDAFRSFDQRNYSCQESE